MVNRAAHPNYPGSADRIDRQRSVVARFVRQPDDANLTRANAAYQRA